MKKATPLHVPILWAISTGIWIIAVCVNIIQGQAQGSLFVIQCGCVLSSGAAAITNFISYKRSKNDENYDENEE